MLAQLESMAKQQYPKDTVAGFIFRPQIAPLIREHANTFLSGVFIKKSGDPRKMVFRRNVSAGVSDDPDKRPSPDWNRQVAIGSIRVHDMQRSAKGYPAKSNWRTFSVNTAKLFKYKGQVWIVLDSPAQLPPGEHKILWHDGEITTMSGG